MKKTRRFASLATAAILAACAVVPATMSALPVSAAATANTITVGQVTDADKANHTYSLYKIFSGNVEKDSLTNITWANESAGTAILTALQGDNTLKTYFGADCDTAAKVAGVLANAKTEEKKAFADDNALMQQFAIVVQGALNTAKIDAVATATSTEGKVASFSNISDDGYYLIVDTTSPMTGNGAYTRYILTQYDASEGAELTTKSALPSVVKKVYEDSALEESYSYKAKPADVENTTDTGYNDVADYNIGDDVPFKLYGTMPSTLTGYEHYYYAFHDTLDDSLTLDVSSIQVTIDGATVAPSNYQVVTSGTSDNCTFEVVFNDVMAAGAKENSSVVVSYKAKLNDNAIIGATGQENKVNLEYSNNPNNEGDGTSKPSDTGKTPDDYVVVFTYELDTKKVDATTKKELANAKFKLYRMNGQEKEYVKVDANSKVKSWDADGSVLTSDAHGLFKVIGLNDGTYYLEETEAPQGYSKLSTPVEVVISSDHDSTKDNNQNGNQNYVGGTSEKGKAVLNALKIKVGSGAAEEDGTPNNGVVNATVENRSGSTLPSTGGIGTTIFYVAGGVLVVGAGVLLITKKRAKDAQ